MIVGGIMHEPKVSALSAQDRYYINFCLSALNLPRNAHKTGI